MLALQFILTLISLAACGFTIHWALLAQEAAEEIESRQSDPDPRGEQWETL